MPAYGAKHAEVAGLVSVRCFRSVFRLVSRTEVVAYLSHSLLQGGDDAAQPEKLCRGNCIDLALNTLLDGYLVPDMLASGKDKYRVWVISSNGGQLPYSLAMKLKDAAPNVNVTIEATGVPQAVKEGIAMTRDGGRYVVVGHYTDTGEITLNPHLEINRKHLDIRGTWGSDFSHFHRMIQILARHGSQVGGGVGWERMISRTYSLYEMNQALADVEAGTVVKALVQPNA